MDRRKFLEHAARGGLLASLLMVAGILVHRDQVTKGNRCPLKSHCRDCRIVHRCSLPQAEKERKRHKG